MKRFSTVELTAKNIKDKTNLRGTVEILYYYVRNLGLPALHIHSALCYIFSEITLILRMILCFYRSMVILIFCLRKILERVLKICLKLVKIIWRKNRF